jgi:hypothetical protein
MEHIEQHAYTYYLLGMKVGVTGAGQVYSARSSYAEYSSIQQAIYGQAVKPTGRFNDRT